MRMMIARGRELLFGITTFARALLVLPLLSAVLTASTLVLALIALRRRHWSLPGRLHPLLVALAGAVDQLSLFAQLGVVSPPA
jgi:hypothetical protein